MKKQDLHRFIDEAGDMTFYKKSHGQKTVSVGDNGVSKCFMIGMVHVKDDLEDAREEIRAFSKRIQEDAYFQSYESVRKTCLKGRHGYYPHAKNDPIELRYEFFKLLRDNIDFTLQVVVGRKDPRRFENQHRGHDSEFYADLLSHLLMDKGKYDGLIIDVAERGSSTSNRNLQHAVEMARELSLRGKRTKPLEHGFKFNVQPYDEEPLLALPDYGLWAVQRLFERGDEKYYNLLIDRIRLVLDLYEPRPYPQHNNYYTRYNPLTCEAIALSE